MAKKQKSGLYRAKIKIGVDADGKSIYKYASGKTQKELERAKREIVEHYIDGRAAAADKLFGAYAVQWYETIKKPSLSLSQQNSYRNHLNNIILPAFGDRNLRAITAMDCQGLLNELQGKSSTYIQTCKTILEAIFKQACIDGLLERNPAEFIIKPDHSEPTKKRAFTPEERERIERVIQEDDDGAVMAVLYYLGLRCGEAMGLQWGDFDWKERTVHIQRDINPYNQLPDELKTKSSNRIVPMPPVLVDLLYPMRQMPTAFCFMKKNKNGRYTYVSFVNRLMRLIEMCNFDERITAHYFRHNYITMCWENGIDVVITAKMVGHAGTETTMKIYTHLNDAFMKKSRGKIDSMFDKKVAQKLHDEDGKS